MKEGIHSELNDTGALYVQTQLVWVWANYFW